MADLALGETIGRRSPLGELRAAVAFLTRVPVVGSGAPSATTGAGAFSVVGAALGAVAAIPLVLAGGGQPVLAAIGAVAILAVLDGGLHLDGLSDTVDALAAPAGAAERARTDPRAGSAGVVAIVLTLAVDVAALAELAGRGSSIALAGLVIAGATSRAMAPLVAVTLGRRAPRVAPGLGTWFADAVTRTQAGVAAGIAALTIAVAAFLTPGPPAGAVLGAVFGAIASAVLVGAVVRARGQLDGDGYGFAIESTFALVLVGAALVR